jgi:hypothetical protein
MHPASADTQRISAAGVPELLRRCDPHRKKELHLFSPNAIKHLHARFCLQRIKRATPERLFGANYDLGSAVRALKACFFREFQCSHLCVAPQ